MSDEPRNLWFITGATSGFGCAIAEAVATRGDIVVGAARSPSGLGDRWQQTAAPARALQAGGCPFEPGTTHPLGIQRRRRC
jgi:NAD(P)-dependent dehydrogenase (short-subunit alcohol dehydrogenase family)